MPDRYDLSLVLPCFNEGEHFVGSVDRIVNVLDQSDYSWEIVFVDDRSVDETSGLIKRYLKMHPRKQLSACFFKKNKGRGAAVAQGLEQAQGRIAGYIDIDLEVPPDYIPRFARAVDNGADVAAGWRIYDFSWRSLLRWLATKGYNVVRDLVLGTDIRDSEAGYKFFRRKKVLPVIRQCRSPGWFWDTEVMVRSERAGLTIRQIPVVFIRRFDKASTVRLVPDTIKYLKELWRFRRDFPRF